MSKDLFDFNDLSDLPEELQGKLTSDTDQKERALADIVAKGNAAGFASLSINQITAAAIRSGIEVPTQTTVRNWLNKAVARKLIVKVSRMSYGVPGTAPIEDLSDDEEEAQVADAAVATDPLADLA